MSHEKISFYPNYPLKMRLNQNGHQYADDISILHVVLKIVYWFKFQCSLFLAWPWWRHQKKTLSALLAICSGNSPVSSEFPAQRPVTQSFDVFFDLRLNKRLSKQSWRWWFETLSRPLWRHRNVPSSCVTLHELIMECRWKNKFKTKSKL